MAGFKQELVFAGMFRELLFNQKTTCLVFARLSQTPVGFVDVLERFALVRAREQFAIEKVNCCVKRRCHHPVIAFNFVGKFQVFTHFEVVFTVLLHVEMGGRR